MQKSDKMSGNIFLNKNEQIKTPKILSNIHTI